MHTLHIEVVQKNCSSVTEAEMITTCFSYLRREKFKTGMVISKFNDRVLSQEVEYLAIEDTESEEYIDITKSRVSWYVYVLHENQPQMETIDDEDGTAVNLATHLTLPSVELFSLWDNLIYDSQIKDNLLKYAATMMEFSKRGVDTNIVTCNRVILLHGPPGTGKTSLCRALAQKLSIRLRYKHNVLIEVNSHSLFSKWFSESGKLVTKMFSRIKEIIEDSKTLVCVLFDEIESLAHAREQCMSGNEPSDSIRVVNAVLTQIDQIKRYPNVIILATSNITGAIDIAFIDRADIKQHLGLPSPQAIYQIYYSCLQELFNVGIIQSNEVFEDIDLFKSYQPGSKGPRNANQNTELLMKLSQDSIGLSGRALRKIPFLAHAMFVDKAYIDIQHFLNAMDKAISYEKSTRNDINTKT